MAGKNDIDESKQGGGIPPVKQVPPWKIAIPFAVFCMIILIQYCFSREPLALFAMAVAAIMGAVWTYGAWSACRDVDRVSRSPVPPSPLPGKGIVISRAKIGGIFNPVGHLLATDNALLWVPWSSGIKTGDSIALATESSVNIVAAFKDIISFRAKAGMFGGETLTLFLETGYCRLRLLDPEGLGNLMAVIPGAEDGSKV